MIVYLAVLYVWSCDHVYGHVTSCDASMFVVVSTALYPLSVPALKERFKAESELVWDKVRGHLSYKPIVRSHYLVCVG